MRERSLSIIPYTNLEEQVDADFARARRKAILRRLVARLRGDTASDRLPCFGQVRRKRGKAGGVRLGRRVVPLARIAGSVGRCLEFDGAFLPASEGARTRWERVDRAFQRGEGLLPVSLYKIGDSYFVEDGNHRVSVARYHGVEWIDAEVGDGVPHPVAKRREGRGHRHGLSQSLPGGGSWRGGTQKRRRRRGACSVPDDPLAPQGYRVAARRARARAMPLSFPSSRFRARASS